MSQVWHPFFILSSALLVRFESQCTVCVSSFRIQVSCSALPETCVSTLILEPMQGTAFQAEHHCVSYHPRCVPGYHRYFPETSSRITIATLSTAFQAERNVG